MKPLKGFILWAVRRTPIWRKQKVVTFGGDFLFKRYAFLWSDEYVNKRTGQHFHRPPWYHPFNAFLHCWRAKNAEEMHDHPRWSVTVCLRGKIVEMTPWGERTLKPGSVVFRTRKAIHGFKLPEEHRGKTWTLFIAGRRNHKQNTYIVKSQE